jgi:hypothetical protein
MGSVQGIPGSQITKYLTRQQNVYTIVPLTKYSTESEQQVYLDMDVYLLSEGTYHFF